MATILIIEDDDDLRMTIAELLEMQGYAVLQASNGCKGLDLVHTRSIDLIITDIFMPDKDGLEVIRELKKGYPHIKVIAVSGGGARGIFRYLDYARKFGVDKAFDKPVDSDVLLDAVEQVLDQVVKD